MTEIVRSELARVATRRQWDGASLYAVVSLLTERSFRCDAGSTRWSPTDTRIGLFQLQEHQARALGVTPTVHPPIGVREQWQGSWATWTLAHMSVEDQVGIIETHLARAFERRAPKVPVDYYLAAWGAAPGLPDGTVIAVEGDSTFERAKELDGDRDGKIAVADLSRALEREMRRTNPREPGPFYEAMWALFCFGIGRRFLK